VAKESVLVRLSFFGLLVAETVARNCTQIEVPSVQGRDAWGDIVIADRLADVELVDLHAVNAAGISLCREARMKLIDVSVHVPDADCKIVKGMLVASLNRLRDNNPGVTSSIEEESQAGAPLPSRQKSSDR
jgi:hypothetical protein